MANVLKIKAKAGCEGCAYFESWTEGDCPHRTECGDEDTEYIFITEKDSKSPEESL